MDNSAQIEKLSRPFWIGPLSEHAVQLELKGVKIVLVKVMHISWKRHKRDSIKNSEPKKKKDFQHDQLLTSSAVSC